MARQSPHACGRSVSTTAAAIAVSLLLIQCDRPAPESPEVIPGPEVSPAPARGPVPTAALSRVDLLNAARLAEQAYAEGRAATQADPLLGRSFAIRMAFGCNGPSTPDAPATGLAQWAWGTDQRTIRIRLAPADWTGSNLVTPAGATASPSGWEAVEGFWVARPWLTTEACPVVHLDPLTPTQGAASPQTLGLAAVFEAGGSRVGRRDGKAYEHTVRPQGDQPLASPSQGYRLLLEGRVVGFPGGRAIQCRAAGPEQRPVCVAAVQLDKVAFEDASGATLSEWRPG